MIARLPLPRRPQLGRALVLAAGLAATAAILAAVYSEDDVKAAFLYRFATYVEWLPAPRTPAYAELDARLGWRISDGFDVSLRGQNLLHSRHLEFAPPDGEVIGRSVLAELRWTF